MIAIKIYFKATITFSESIHH